jgi:hypothetical protein
MISRVWVLAALLGCGADAPSARTRVLDKIPAGVTSIAVADSRALVKFRAVVDVLRSEVPAGFDCVLDAALEGQQIAAGIGPDGDLTVALASRAPVKCPALSAVEDGLYIATLGAGAPGAGALAEQTRARPFLKDAPIALVTRLGAMRVIGTAQPDPPAAWVAFDAADGAAATLFQSDLQTRLAALPVTVDRIGSQVVARLVPTPHAERSLRIDNLAAVLRTALPPRQNSARVFACPAALTPPVLTCVAGENDHNTLDVYSLASVFDELLGARKELVVSNGRVEGVRFTSDLATYGLASGDLLVAVDGQRLTSIDQVAPTLQRAKVHVQLLVSRSRRFGTLELVEH